MNTTTKDHHLSHATTRPPLPKKMVALANEEEKKKMMAMKDDEVILTRSRLNNKVVTKILPNFLPSRSRSYHAPASEVKGNNLKTSPTNFFDKVGYEVSQTLLAYLSFCHPLLCVSPTLEISTRRVLFFSTSQRR